MEGLHLEDEKSVGPPLFGAFESKNNARLPKNEFISFFTWSCYEVINSSAFRIWLLLCLMLIAGWKFYSCIAGGKPFVTNMEGPIKTEHQRSSGFFLKHYSTIVTIVICFLLSFSWEAFKMYRERALGKQITQFAKEIIKSTPSIDMESWDSVAVNFNSYMYENKLWNTEYYFFDGSSCHLIFRRTLLWLSAAMDDDSKLNIFRKHPYIEEALKVYFAEVDRKWNLINSQKSSSNIAIENIQLPGKSYRFKIFQFFKKTIKERTSIVMTIISYLAASLNFCPSKQIDFVQWKWNIKCNSCQL
ncbi:Ecm34p SPAR_H00020 [Saccharomyces paradoxus]|uniref:Ecm34p n=1 Tax=Saccharomyces paradoxus TaxID=27291 RepID=A0A8B8US66_SACPA|nr:uncharacterized protein SPAR_H00020 [Saccharomyces paradoxus]QHS73598.1 hypothetical protein SPAR_H00020 [Saccharomyces paradoxus]